MKSLTELYKIGAGPSSSHTMGPEKACKIFAENYKDADSFKVILYGSLAMTGKGHGTDRIVISTLKKPTEVIFNTEEKDIPHENTMDLIALSRGNVIDRWRVLSVGGGAIEIVGRGKYDPPRSLRPQFVFGNLGILQKTQNPYSRLRRKGRRT